MPRSYVDNASNRSLGRVGMPVGSMVVSKGSSGGGGSGYSCGAGSSYGSGAGSGYGSGVGSSYGRRGSDSYSSSSDTSSSNSRAYVDNASNRSLCRVGMSVGSMVVSKGSSGGKGSSSYGSRGGESYSSMSGNRSSSSKPYVDNTSNPSLGRVEAFMGTIIASYSSPSSARSPSSKTYVDNTYNRQLGRVGMPHGSAAVSKSGVSDVSACSPSSKTYVDNTYNRQLGRVGMAHGSAVVSRSGVSANSLRSKTSVDSFCKQQPECGDLSGISHDSGIGESPKVYKDNDLNRRLGRVGKPLRSCVVSGSGSSSKGASRDVPVYVDNSLNRRLGRVGKPRGSMPLSRVSQQTENTRRIRDKMLSGSFKRNLDYGYGEEFNEMEVGQALSLINRRLEELSWQESKGERNVKTASSILKQYTGVEIAFAELELGKKIGQGGFGDVFFATWHNSVVAVKKLRVQRVSKRRLYDFSREVMTFCGLEHPNIVKFIGACLTTPNLCIVMEYMHTCLYTALYMSEREIEFSEAEKLSILQQTSEGLLYLHQNHIAHCDLKSQNILMEYKAGESCVAKITDFGLSMIRANSESSASALEQVRNIGTPRYSAPEVLRGEMLSAKDMLRSDVYGLALIMFEVLYQEEPYYGLNYAMLQKQVGYKGATPEIPDSPGVSSRIMRVMKSCWDYYPKYRPAVSEVVHILNQQTYVYLEA